MMQPHSRVTGLQIDPANPRVDHGIIISHPTKNANRSAVLFDKDGDPWRSVVGMGSLQKTSVRWPASPPSPPPASSL